jgi:hypothetical protein
VESSVNGGDIESDGEESDGVESGGEKTNRHFRVLR